MLYLVQPRYRMFVKWYALLYFPKILGKNISRNLRAEYSQKLLDQTKQTATDALKNFLKRSITISKVSKTPPNNSLGMNIIKKYLKKDKYL